MSWKRIDHLVEGESCGRPAGSGDKFCRTYGLDGALWPRILIAISAREERLFRGIDAAVIVSTNYKNALGEWWENCPIPLELVEDLAEMIKEFKDTR